MPIDLNEYYTPEDWGKFMSEAAKHETPFLLINLDIIRRKFKELRRLMPGSPVCITVGKG